MAERIRIDCCPVDCVNGDEAAVRCLDAIADGVRVVQVAPVNAATVVEARDNLVLRGALEKMDLLLPDGFYLRPAAALTRQSAVPHTPTVPLVLHLLARLAERGGSVYLLGARGEVVQAAAFSLVNRFSGLRIAGARDGYFTGDEEPAVVGAINASQPDLLLIGISSPKREIFMARWRGALAVPVTIGVGGMIDILGGRTAAGPDWLRGIGMMWLYRLAQEPRRMWRRYTMTNLRFLGLVLRQALTAPRGSQAVRTSDIVNRENENISLRQQE